MIGYRKVKNGFDYLEDSNELIKEYLSHHHLKNIDIDQRKLAKN